jgi:phosphoserine phosphatase
LLNKVKWEVGYNTLICDWNGTIIEDRDEMSILRNIAVDLFKASIPIHPFRMAHILKVRGKLENLHRERRQEAEFDFVREMFQIYNAEIISGLPVHFIHRSVDKYAMRQQTQQKLDYRVLGTIKECHQAGKVIGILSAGYKHGIERILTTAGYSDYFDFCQANQLKEENGRAIGFGLDIYRNKSEMLLKLLRNRNLDERKLVYLGDSEGDEGCFEIVKYPVVAFFAPEELKERYAQKYHAFVPENERDLVKFLKAV